MNDGYLPFRDPDGYVQLMSNLYNIKAKDIEGTEKSLSEYQGKVLLIVNVASKCGFTPQYKGLESLYKRYQQRGFVVLGFPANDFGRQEPGTDEEIKSFCSLTYGVTFPMFSKVSVKGKSIHPLYAFLTEKETNPRFAGKITWNFNKFLLDRAGKIVNRFDSKVEPTGDRIPRAIEEVLGR
jgi:glutathione peroxidase